MGQRPWLPGAPSSCWGTVWLTGGRMRILCQEKEICRLVKGILRESDKAENAIRLILFSQNAPFLFLLMLHLEILPRQTSGVCKYASRLHWVPSGVGTVTGVSTVGIRGSPRFCPYNDHPCEYTWLFRRGVTFLEVELWSQRAGWVL